MTERKCFLNHIFIPPVLQHQLKQVWKLSVPSILTQITSILMQYIDSAMVGNLGANASAAIGLITTSTYLFGGISAAISAGFSVQVAQYIGANQSHDARRVVRHGLVTTLLFSIGLTAIGIAISGKLPIWLGGEQVLWQDSSRYFFVYSAALPFMLLNQLAASCLQCSSNMVVPSVLNAAMCLLDILLNAILIPRYGVLGAALGTAGAMAIVSILMLFFCCVRSTVLRIDPKEPCPFDRSILKRALKIGMPVGTQEIAVTGAMIVATRIIAPLGTVSIAAHSFAVTAESLCYMPGFGIAAAATTLVGQSAGAGEYDRAKKLSYISTAFGCCFMSVTAIIMYFACPFVFQLLTPDLQVRALSTQVLRIEMFAEPLYAISIVASGALRGVEDTLIPSLMNLFSIWVVRLGLSILLVGRLGLIGAWVAMAIELSVRGLLLLYRLRHSKHFSPSSASSS